MICFRGRVYGQYNGLSLEKTLKQGYRSQNNGFIYLSILQLSPTEIENLKTNCVKIKVNSNIS